VSDVAELISEIHIMSGLNFAAVVGCSVSAFHDCTRCHVTGFHLCVFVDNRSSYFVYAFCCCSWTFL